MNGIILIIIGILICIFSHPKVSGPIIQRLLNEGLVNPKVYKPEDAEVIKHAGPNVSMFAIGIIFMLVGFLLAVF